MADEIQEVEDVFKGENVSLSEMNQYRADGELPERFKVVAESAPDDTPEETETAEGESLEPSPDSDPDDKQEPKPSKRDKRIQQLLEKNNELERKLAEKQDVKTESSPAAATHTHPKPTPEDKNPDGTPKYKDYEEVVEAIGRWAAKEERTTWEREQSEREAKKSMQAKLDEARTRYDDADSVIFPTNQAIEDAKIPIAVKQVLYDSKVYIDLCYVIGSDPDELKSFISLAKSDPRSAIGKVFEYERGIGEVFSKLRDDEGKFKAPETRKTSAPKPASVVNGASSRAFDVSDESLSTEEWAKQRRQQLANKG